MDLALHNCRRPRAAHRIARDTLQVELLESRLLLYHGPTVLPDGSMEVRLDETLDQFGFQAAMFQSYVFHINGLGIGGNGQSVIVDPAGRVLHKAQAHEALMPIEIDLDVVRRQRERGLLGLGQPLKSFRDSTVDFTVYDRARFDRSYLDDLGPLEKPARGDGRFKSAAE